MILYYAPGACSLAPHIALEETGVPFETHRIDLTKSEQLSDGYTALNPRGRVPILIVDHQVVTEVPALLTFIAGLNPDAQLVPKPGTLAHGRCFEWLGFLSSTVHVAYAQFRRPERFVPADSPHAGPVSDHGKEICIRLWKEIDQRLAGGKWAAGDIYSIADPYLLPFYTWKWRLDLEASDLPNWSAWVERIKERPAVQRALATEGWSL
jgi:glutathione S-transferase